MVTSENAALAAALAALVLVALAEALHARRVRRVAELAFGPSARAATWARAAPYARALAAALLAWGFVTLIVEPPKRHSLGKEGQELVADPRHVLLVLDVSPSMRLQDAGPTKTQARMQRARDVMESFFDRVPLEEFRISVVATYNGAKPVVVDTRDFEVVRNILGDLPMHYAFPVGKTKLFDGLEEAARLAKPWNPRSTTVVLVTDGDTVPATGMPKMPASVGSVIVVGVGDPQAGKFIDGRHSRQDVPALKQIAARLNGSYHNGNDGQVPTPLIAEAFGIEVESVFERLTKREYALIAILASALLLALLPLLLHVFGTRWVPGVRAERLENAVKERTPGRRLASASTMG